MTASIVGSHRIGPRGGGGGGSSEGHGGILYGFGDTVGYGVTVSNLTPLAGSTIQLQAQKMNPLGMPTPLDGIDGTWSVVVYDGDGTDVTGTTTYSFDHTSDTTDSNGMVFNTLTVDGVAGRYYVVLFTED